MNISAPAFSREIAHVEGAIQASNSIRVRRISSFVDMGEIARLRQTGYRYFDSPRSTIDDLDFSANCTHLVAETTNSRIVGTVRILSGPEPTELDNHLDLNEIDALKSRSFGEASRLVVANSRNSFAIKTLLSKACWIYCLENKLDYLIATAKPENARYYSFLQMQNLGEDGHFRHSILGNSLHMTYLIKVDDVVNKYTECNHAFKLFMLHQKHDIDLSGPPL